MRKLVDAPRKKKQWTEKEEAYLQDKWGTVSIKGLSKALGRSENAIIVRAQRLGCGAHLAGDTRISLNQLMLAIYGKNLLSKGTYTYSDLAAELRHSEGAIKRRILDLGINKKPVRCPPENGRRTRWKPCAAW